jgi:hypothetical protein
MSYFDGLRREISPHSDSDECLKLIRKWDKECQHAHQYCKVREVPKLPKRVIYVGCEEAGNPVRLHETSGDRAHYIALSHCWGQQSFLKTERATLQERIKGLHWEELSPNFKDAIAIARKLGINYVWIDALCIVVSGIEPTLPIKTHASNSDTARRP